MMGDSDRSDSAGGDDLLSDVHRLAAAALRMTPSQLDLTGALSDYGIDSIAITEIMGQIARFLGVAIAPTTFFEARTLRDLAAILRARHADAVLRRYALAEPGPAPEATPPHLQTLIARHRAGRTHAASIKPAAPPQVPVAIIAMDGAFARSPDLDALAVHLQRGEDCIETVPPDRWDWRDVEGDPARGPFTRVRTGGFIPDHAAFDAAFFGISPKEAELMDPQHRLFMQCAWRLVESAGHAPGSLAGRKVGLFLGINLQDYADLANRAGLKDPMQMVGLGHAFCANRLSFLLDIHGPSQVIDTACSSSLVALHRAVLSIRHEGCEMAIAGGSNLMLSPTQHILFSRIGMLAPDGRCKSFGQDADGYGRADGVGAVLLKRLDLAERDGDPILAVIRGSAESHGGAASSLTAPNPAAQAHLIVDACRQADIDPRSITLIECHGTGTKLGDPVEIDGLKAAFATLYADRGLPPPVVPHCGIGSVKSVIGHTETAAGIAGIIKVLLAMRHATQFRSLHCVPANPLIDLAGSPFHLLDAARPWPRPVIDGQEMPRRAGISSFGAGGSNAHVVIEDYVAPAMASRPVPGSVIVPLSARDEPALLRIVARLAAYLDREQPPLQDLAFTLQLGRDAMRVRMALVAEGMEDLRRQLGAILAGERDGVAVGIAGRGTAGDTDGIFNPRLLAARWVAGASVDWVRLHDGSRRRLALPAYPFAGPRYCLPQAEPVPLQSTPDLRFVNPPMFLVPAWRPVMMGAAAATSFVRRDLLLCGMPERDFGQHLAGWAVAEDDAPASDLAAHALAALRLLQAAVRTLGPVLVQLVIPATPGAALLPALGALLRTARLEHPGLCAQLLVIEPDAEPAAVAARLRQFAANPHIIHLRETQDGVLTPAWQPVTPPPAPPVPWQLAGVHLITGGLGGIGRLLAEDIVQRAPRAVVILASRTPPDRAALDWIAGLQGSNGSRVEHVVADLTEAAATRALVGGIQVRHGRLDVVLHAAGALRDGRLLEKTPSGLTAILAPKLEGARHLDAAVGDTPLRLFLLFASLSGVVGSAGQADYATANAALDAFAAQREERRHAGLCQGRTVAIDWPLWQDGGMRMPPESEQLMRTATGLIPLSTDTALAALDAVVALGRPQVLVAAGDRARVERLLDPPAAPRLDPPPAVTVAAFAESNSARRHATLNVLSDMVSAQLKVAPDDLAPDIEFGEYGYDSIGFTQFANALNDRFGLDLTPVVFFEHQTLAQLADHLMPLLGLGSDPASVFEPAVAPESKPVFQPAPAPTPPGTAASARIAIVGLSGVFPGAANPEALWKVLRDGRDCIAPMPVERRSPGIDVPNGGFIETLGTFDAEFFGLSAAVARAMDPQQRLLLTLAWRLLEDANIAPRRLWGADVGVFIGIGDTGYGHLLATAGEAGGATAATGLAPSGAPNRISFHFNLNGPSQAIETACSSSLVAIHRAVAAIRAGECDMAIAGGANALLLPATFEGFGKAGMLASDGRCKTFSAAADGYGRGEGAGLVLLRRLDDAERDGDRILAVICATAENHGGRANSLTAPNPTAQAALLRRAYEQAGFDPRSVGYIEAHGTGTPLGDPIEVEALRTAFADLAREAEARFGPAPPMRCALGSVKSNIGHLEIAAGAAGIAKVLLQMQHGTLARTLHAETPNPLLALAGGPFRLVQRTQPWERARDAAGQILPRRAGVSGFGFGGSNAHVVLEEYVAPVRPEPALQPGPALIVLSGRTEAQLSAWVGTLLDALPGLPDPVTIADIAFTLQTCRDGMEHRLAFSAGSRAALAATLAAIVAGRSATVFRGQVKEHRTTLALLDSDAVLRDALAGLPGRGRHDLMLDLWVRGFAFDWRALYAGIPPHRVKLPDLPLQKTVHWVRTSAPEDTAPTVPLPYVAAAPPVADARGVLERLTAIAAQMVEAAASDLDPGSEFGEFGFDSITMTGFAARVNAEIGAALTPADFFEFATLDRLARHLAGSLPQPAPSQAARPEPDRVHPAKPQAIPDDPVAIVGMSCHFPGAPDADSFWRNLLTGYDAITEIPADRWDWRAFDGDPKLTANRTKIRWGGFIDGVFAFDPLLFGISPREAQMMDPQQRLMLLHAWKAIEDAGHAPRGLAGRSVGVFVGTASSGFVGEGDGGYGATGSVPSVGPNRISFLLDLHGPSEPVETACSSALVAIHRAVQAMAAGDCEMALAGGVNTMVTPEGHIGFDQAGMLSPDGRCHTFSADANGYVRGEGVGMFFLKRLSAATRDGDPVLAVIRGSAINHGGRANSLTAPNTEAQAALLRQAYQSAGVDVGTVGFIEAHGTGTALGDPVEVNALKSAFATLSPDGLPEARCGLGSVKTGIGHLELAAGAAGLAKIVLQMRHRTLAPSLHADPPNPYIDLSGTPFFVVQTAQPWTPARGADGAVLPLRAGVSSFGFGGVNAHVVLEEPPVPAPSASADGPALIVLSGHNQERLQDQIRQFVRHLEVVPDIDLHDLAYTLQLGRSPLRCRLALVAASVAAVGCGLQAVLDGDAHPALLGEALPDRSLQATASGMDLAVLARHWVSGGSVDWAALHSGARRRLRLPTYPFGQDIFRNVLPQPEAAMPVAHPPQAEAAGSRTHLDAALPAIRDHRVQGVCVVPGAMVLELARTAAEPQGEPVSLHQVVWLRPLAVPTGQMLGFRIVLNPDSKGRAFRLEASPDSTLHAQGRVQSVATQEPPLDLAAIEARCTRPMPVDRLYRTYAELGLDYGPTYRSVAALQAGTAEVLACLTLPDGAQEGFLVHPSMLDGAFQACMGLMPDDATEGTAVPFALDRLDVFGPTTAAMWAHVRSRPGDGKVRRLDIDMACPDGTIRVQVRGLSVRLLPAPRKPPDDTREAATAWLTAILAEETLIPADAIEADAPFETYGLDSVLITRLTDRLEAQLGPLSKTLFFEHATLTSLAGHLIEAHAPRLPLPGGAAPRRVEPAAAAEIRPVTESGAVPLAQRRDATVHAPFDPGPPEAIAIIGLAGRYPGAPTLDAFWDNLAAGRDSITEVPASRWDHARWFDPVRGRPGKTNSKWGGFIDDVDRFDPLFFNIAPREADFMDPQERLFLQCAWEAMEDAGHTRASLALTPGLPGANVGVFVGVMYAEYQLYGAESTAAGQPLALGGSAASIANRVSYACGFHGPSLAVDTMCSSSVTAIHLACESLRAGGCDAALAGGVNLTLHPNKYLALAQGRFTSSNGRCESFGRGGDGYVPGEGVGAVLLKPLSRAIADGDRIQGVIRGTAVNHGGRTNGYTVPNPHAQADVIRRAIAAAGADPLAIGYIEAHGTGTILGDPIEIAALAAAFGNGRPAVCPIGSVKSNIGHAESAAGIAGLTKLLLQFRHEQLVPSLHADPPNPGIDFAAAGFRVQRRLEPWPRIDGAPRVAGLSSFGAGGSNAHLVIEDYVAPAVQRRSPGPVLYPFSARDPATLEAVVARFLDADPSDLDAAAFTLQEGREAFEHRLAVVATDRASLRAALQASNAHKGQRRAGIIVDPALLHRRDLTETDLHAVAAAWVQGAVVDWANLRTNEMRRCALPTYPFARERHWFAPAPAMPPLLFTPDWQTQPATPSHPASSRRLVIVCGTGAAVPLEAEHRVLDPPETDPAARFAAYATGFADLLRPLITAPPGPALVQLVVPLEGDPALPEALAGILRCACHERAGLRGQTIALDRPTAPLDLLLQADAEADDPDIRHVGPHRLVRHWAEAAPSLPPAAPWKDGGIYLITGGVGGIGRLLCEEIARRVSTPTICLVGRSPVSVPQVAGATIVHHICDITRPEAVHALIATLRRNHGGLDGIVHAAGLTRDAALHCKEADDIRRVLAPKVAGVLNLDAATAGLDLDLFLLFASASGALGNAGQADYAAANAFLDVFAASRNQQVSRGLRQGVTLSIDWPYWRDGGMRLPPARIAALERATGVRPLETASAMVALGTAFAMAEAGATQVLVLDGDQPRLRASLPLSKGTDAALPMLSPASWSHTSADEKRLLPSPLWRGAGGEGRDGVSDDSLCQTPETFRPSPLTPLHKVEGSPATPVRGVNAVARPALDLVRSRIAAVLGIDPATIDDNEPFDRYGMDSIAALQFVEALGEMFGPVPITLPLEHPTLARLTQALESQFAAAESAPPPDATIPADGIAVIAMAGRYPGAPTVEAFWEALCQGRDLVTEIPAERWDHAAIFDPEKGRPGTAYCRWGGFLDGVDRFDAAFFGISPRDAARMDPQERLFLETVYHLLERAGHTGERLRRQYESRVGVFVGSMYQHYQAFATEPDDRALLSLSTHGGLANRVSFVFDLQGPSVAVDAMCASGLEAVHLACQALLRGECRLAIAGGVNLSLHPDKYVGLSRAALLGSHAESRAFADGDGYLPAEAVGAVLLKPLADAMRDGDTILGVIKASASNHGGHSAGYGVPSFEAQVRLIEENLHGSGIDPRSIGYVEAAATGAILADAIEVRALAQAFRSFTCEVGFCALGSVKSNMGHAEAASGLAQLTKAILQLHHRHLVPSVRAAALNPNLRLEGTPFRFQSDAMAWPQTVVDGVPRPLRATVSSFGAGGSNVHMILEQAPPRPVPASVPSGPRLFVMSARTEAQLAEVVRGIEGYLRTHPDTCMARLAHTLRTGRERHSHVAELVADGRDDLLARIEAGPRTLSPPPGPPLIDDPGLPLLDLPGYPFARDRHWLDATPPAPMSTPKLEQGALSLILHVLAEETGVSAPAPAATFRALGATSMFALRLIRTCTDQLGVELSHRDLETHPTALALAEAIAARARVVPTDPASQAAAPGPTPLSLGQAALWALQKLQPDTGAYNVPIAFRISRFDLVALGQACRALLQHYPILGDRFDDRDGTPYRIPGRPDAQIQHHTLPPGPDLLAFARGCGRRPFRLAEDAPIRFDLIAAGQDGILLITIHHIAIDGLSALLAARAFWEAYDVFAAGRLPPPPPPSTDHATFVAWERAYLASPRGASDLAYWTARLSDCPLQFDLPADRSALATAADEGQSLERVLSTPVTEAARSTAARLGINPSILFLGALKILLCRLTGQDQVLVGMPTLGRPERRFESSVGLFANVIPVVTTIDPAETVAALLTRLQAQVTEGLDHAHYPYADLCRRFGAGGRALHQIGYAWQGMLEGTPPGEVLAGTTRVSHLDTVRQQGDAALALEVTERRDSLRLVAVFDPARYGAARIEALLDQFTSVLQAVCAEPGTPVRAVPVLDEATQARLLRWGQGPPMTPRAGSVHEWIGATAARHPDATAVTCDGECLSYRRLVRRARRLAGHLQAQGAGPGTRVGVLLDRGPRSIEALLAVFGSGAAWVPLDPGSPDARLGAIAVESGLALLLTDASLERRVRRVGAGTKLVQLDRDRKAIRRQGAKSFPCFPVAESPAYIIHTSGSTGRPKGVVVPHGAIGAHCLAVIDRYGLDAGDTVLQFAPHDVDTALEQILPTLVCGARLLLRGPKAWTAADLRGAFDRERASVADLPPAYLQTVLNAWAQDPASAPQHAPRLLIVGGETMPPDLVRSWQAGPLAKARLLNAYGPTEATVTATAHELTAGADGPAPIGRPLPGVIVRILDAGGAISPEGVPGELHIGGRLALGYHGRPDLTEASFVADPLGPPGTRLYRTGDLAMFLAGQDGLIGFLGRRDDQVQIRGFRVEPAEVEAALACPGGPAVAVVALPGLDNVPMLTAFVAAPDGFDTNTVMATATTRLPPPMRPTTVIRLDTLPTTPSGKIDRQSLRRMAPSGRPAPPVAALPIVSATEARLREIWREVLNASDPIGIDDDFFAHGGHSLLAVRLVATIERRFGATVTLADLIAAPTIARQARLLEAPRPSGPAAAGSTVVHLRAGGRVPLFCIHAAAGTIGCYMELSRHLDPAWAVYGIQSANFHATAAPPRDLAAMAAAYAGAMRGIQPQGPFHLIGWSVGGTIAFEVARQLEVAGRSVRRLVLLDSFAPALHADSDRGVADSVTAFAHDIAASAGLDPATCQCDGFLRCPEDLLTIPALRAALDGVDAGRLRRMHAVFVATLEAVRTFRPARTRLPVTLFRAVGGLPADHYGWCDLVGKKFKVKDATGRHHTMLTGRHAKSLAAQLPAPPP